MARNVNQPAPTPKGRHLNEKQTAALARARERAKAGGKVWKPASDGDFIVGTLVDVTTGVSQFNGKEQKKLLLRLDGGEDVVVFCNAKLAEQATGIGVGEEVVVTYEGQAEGKNGRQGMKLYGIAAVEA
jgi:hypothetical protein